MDGQTDGWLDGQPCHNMTVFSPQNGPVKIDDWDLNHQHKLHLAGKESIVFILNWMYYHEVEQTGIYHGRIIS